MKHVVLYHRHFVIEQKRPDCTHGALALAIVILVLIVGYMANQIGVNAYACNVAMLMATVYALLYVLFVEVKNWIDRSLRHGPVW
jgi:hypothetical protein